MITPIVMSAPEAATHRASVCERKGSFRHADAHRMRGRVKPGHDGVGAAP